MRLQLCVYSLGLCFVFFIITVHSRRDAKVPLPCGQEISSDVSKNGSFTSPNYPEPYPADVLCVYSFMGKGKERVQIQFVDFDLHLPHEPPRDCEGVDVVMVFITINGQKERVDNFCGNKSPPQLMSNGPSMQVEFKSRHSSNDVKGFKAIFKFVTDFGVSSGAQDHASVCGFIFDSNVRSNGTFVSPNYPGYYPRDTECHYFFHGKAKERVHITFNKFNVDGIPPCSQDTASDYVELSNYRTVDRKIPRHCGVKKPSVIESDNDFFRVTFKSNSKFDGTGFEATYQFKPYIDPATVKRISNGNTNSTNSGTEEEVNSFLLFLVPNIVYLFFYI